jgi:hypothetical protein
MSKINTEQKNKITDQLLIEYFNLLIKLGRGGDFLKIARLVKKISYAQTH